MTPDFVASITIEVATFSADSNLWSGILGLCPQNEQLGEIDADDLYGNVYIKDAVAEQRVLQRNTVPY
jgi:hypothetical protein